MDIQYDPLLDESNSINVRRRKGFQKLMQQKCINYRTWVALEVFVQNDCKSRHCVKMTIVDNDTVDLSNINRQIPALTFHSWSKNQKRRFWLLD